MDKLPFAPYDFFGYLASGFLFTAACQATFGFPKVLGQQINAVDGLFLLLTVYIMGHVLATPAKAVLEDVLVDKVLKRPSVMRHILSPRTSHVISRPSSQIGDRTNDGCGIGYLLV